MVAEKTIVAEADAVITPSEAGEQIDNLQNLVEMQSGTIIDLVDTNVELRDENEKLVEQIENESETTPCLIAMKAELNQLTQTVDQLSHLIASNQMTPLPQSAGDDQDLAPLPNPEPEPQTGAETGVLPPSEAELAPPVQKPKYKAL